LTEDRQSTKEKLLDAAEDLFAAKEFENVSIRELAAVAEVNVAAVNYHFQNKDNLFREVVKRRFVIQRDRILAAFDSLLEETGGRPRVDQVIRALVRHHLEGALPEQGGPSFMGLVARHMQPGQTHMAGPFFKTMVAPLFSRISQVLLMARPQLEPDQVAWIIASIIGQIQHLLIRWEKRRDMETDPESLQIMLQAFPALGLSQSEYIEQVTDHITRFSTAAIDGLFPEVAP
jgi:AcrR family transcriptional regulator